MDRERLCYFLCPVSKITLYSEKIKKIEKIKKHEGVYFINTCSSSYVFKSEEHERHLSWKREIVAYYFIKEYGLPEMKKIFPKTELGIVEIDKKTKRKGSLQIYINHIYDYGNTLPLKVKGQELVLIALIDLLFVNTDRHEENILVDESGSPYPIDHEMIFPSSLPSDELDFQLTWDMHPYMKKPFTKDIISYIENLNLDNICIFLEKVDIEKQAIDIFKMSLTALKIQIKIPNQTPRILASFWITKLGNVIKKSNGSIELFIDEINRIEV